MLRAVPTPESILGFRVGDDFKLAGYDESVRYFQAQAAALEVRHGAGRVILLGFRRQWRGQTRGNFRVVFNALLHGRAVAARIAGDPGFWTPPAARP